MGEENNEPENKFEKNISGIVVAIAVGVIIIKLIVIFIK